MAERANNIQVKVSDDPRMEEILDLCSNYTALDFSQRIEPDPTANDDLSALIVGLDTLGEELQHLVDTEREQREELRVAAEEQSKINKELEQFIYISSHDLQEPLRTIKSFIELIESQFLNDLPEAMLPMFGFIQQSVARMSDQIFDLLNYLRVLKGKRIVRVSLNEVVENLLVNKASFIQEHKAEIEVESLPDIIGFEEQSEILFENLLTNAIKFSHPDRAPKISITSEQTPTGVKIKVKDNGIGIEEQYFSRIFQIFQRLHNKRDIPGTGMGLALCEKIVSNHGGSISLSSIPGEGSTFTVYLRSDISSSDLT